MNAKVYSGTEIIGQTHLRILDKTRCIIGGELNPNQIYLTKIRPILWQFYALNCKCTKSYNELKLNIQLDNGYFILPTGELEIFDSEEFKEKPIGLNITGVFTQVIEDYFINTYQLPILHAPWEFVDIRQKIEYESRLYKEMNLNTNHPLLKAINKLNASFSPSVLYFSATAFYNHYILFALYYTCGLDYEFAVVHLPQSKKSFDKTEYNSIEFYKDFDEFKYRRAFLDKVEWEY